MPGELTRGAPQDALQKRVDPEVQTLAKPETNWLLQARANLNSDEQLQGILQQGIVEGLESDDIADLLAVRLSEMWEGHPAEAYEAALYLVDEFKQLGEGIHLVSRETGRVVTTLTDDDIYQGGPLPRADGSMATPLPQVRPDLAAYVTTWTFEKGREQRITEELARRGHQTALLREEGDPRLRVATRAGRREIVQRLVDHTPTALLRACGGTSAAFLQHFDLVGEDPGDTALEPLEGFVSSRSAMGIQDQTTVNLHHDREGTLRGALSQGWVREIAACLSKAAHQRFGPVCREEGLYQDISQLDSEEMAKWKATFWVAPPEAVTPLRRLRPNWNIMPAGEYTIGFIKPKVGLLVLPDDFGAETQELFDKWTAGMHLEFKLWIDWKAICYCALTGLEHQGVVTTRMP